MLNRLHFSECVVHNPLFALVEIISKLKDAKGKILIPGFYKGVEDSEQRRIESLEAAALQRGALSQNRSRLQGFDGRAGIFSSLSNLGASNAGSAWHARWIRGSGSEDGNSCSALRRRFPCGFVPNQDPEDIFKRYMRIR